MPNPMCGHCRQRAAIYRVTGTNLTQPVDACDTCLPAVQRTAGVPRETRLIGRAVRRSSGQDTLFDLGETA